MRYHKNPSTLGMAGNWNKCLSEAESDLVTLLHADDKLLETYCDVMLQAAGKYPAAVGYFCEATIINESGNRNFSLPDMVKRFMRPHFGEAASRRPPCECKPAAGQLIMYRQCVIGASDSATGDLRAAGDSCSIWICLQDSSWKTRHWSGFRRLPMPIDAIVQRDGSANENAAPLCRGD